MMRRSCAVATLAAAAVVLDASTARATCDARLVSQAVVARLSKDTMDKVLTPLATLVPRETTLPAFSSTLSECPFPFDDNIVSVSNGHVKLDRSSYAVQPVSGGLDMEIRGNVDATLHLDLVLCALPNDSCEAHVVARDVTAHAHANIGVDACVPTLSVDAMQILVDENNVDIELTGCAAYATAFDLTEDWLRGPLLDAVTAKLDTILPDIVATEVSALTSDLIEPTGTYAGVDLAVQLESIGIDSGGITMSFAAGAFVPTLADCIAGVDWRRVPGASPGTITLPPSTSVGISGLFAQNLVESAWKAGWLCIDMSSLTPGITDVFSSIVPGTTTRVTLNASAPPRLTLLAGDPGSATFELPTVSGHVAVDVPSDRQYTADFTAALSLTADATMNPWTREVVLSPRAAEITPYTVALGNSSLGFSRDGIDRFVQHQLIPLMTSKIPELPILGGIFDARLMAFTIESLRTTDGGIVAEIGVAEIDADDGTPPQTVVGAVPVCPCPARVTIGMASHDNSTSSELVRHLVAIDNNAGELRAGTSIVLTALTEGSHVIHMQAVDLMGNTDPHGAAVEVRVDTTAPTVRFVNAPRGVVESSGTRLTIEAADETALADRITYEIGTVSPTAAPDAVFASGALRLGERLPLDNLPDGSTVRVRVLAFDKAGNSALATLTLAVLDEPTMGCAAVPADGVVIFGVLLLDLLRRRHRART